MTPHNQRLTVQRRRVLDFIDHHGSITADELRYANFGQQVADAYSMLWKMHAAKFIRVKSWRRGNEGPPKPVFCAFDGEPDARKPAPRSNKDKSKRYREGKTHRVVGPREAPAYSCENLAYRLFVIKKITDKRRAPRRSIGENV